MTLCRKAAIAAALAASLLAAFPRASAQPAPRSTSHLPPRKIIVGTAIRSFWKEPPGLEPRLKILTALVDEMAGHAQKKYGRGLDVAVLPETAVASGVALGIDTAVPFEGRVQQVFAEKARQHRTYIVVPMSLLENKAAGLFSNAAVLIDRNGRKAGVYRKVHLAVLNAEDSMENGTTPGRETPVFETDFGKLGIQICFDMEFDDGWAELARKGADLVVWPTASPQTAHPVARAIEGRFYIVSSPYRHNATIFEPTGKVAAQIRPPHQTLVEEIDLSYALLPWSPNLRNGATLKEKYGPKIGFRYYEEEDLGIFWSNDPATPIGRMTDALGLAEAEQELHRIRNLYSTVPPER